MKITSVEYRETRTFGSYQNCTVGATADVGVGEDPETALSDLKEWAHDQLAERIGKTRDDEEDQYEQRVKSRELVELEDKVNESRNLWERAKEFLASHGLSVDEEAPF